MGTGSSVLLPVIVAADPSHFCDMCGIEMDWGSEDETKCGYSYSYGWQEKTYARRDMTEVDASTRLHRFVIGSDGRCRTCGKAECRHFGAPRYCYRFTDRTYRESCCNCTLEKGRIGGDEYVRTGCKQCARREQQRRFVACAGAAAAAKERRRQEDVRFSKLHAYAVAFCMSTHPRLGCGLAAQGLDADVCLLICREAGLRVRRLDQVARCWLAELSLGVQDASYVTLPTGGLAAWGHGEGASIRCHTDRELANKTTTRRKLLNSGDARGESKRNREHVLAGAATKHAVLGALRLSHGRTRRTLS